ncbi:hypothetical protein [Saliphagus infecundisoli]|uniref:DUF4352 domain-containing protein n=1 Tax=Saliphagus infecundisoli TaxID=1849069 RepID=A0ABD5QHX9_9EURY|nr:hypothetical protein [Saliphagus infecundisoli]
MRRRRYLSAVWAAAVGSVAGCVAPPRAIGSDAAGTETSDSTAGPVENGTGDEPEASSGNETEDDETAYVFDYVELDLMDRFVLEDSDIALVVTDTRRLEPAELGADLGDQDAFAVRMTATDESGDGAELDHELFWLEGLDPDESAPDPALSERLSEGVSGTRTRLSPGAKTDIEIAFAIPPDLDPKYLWARQYYVCLV